MEEWKLKSKSLFNRYGRNWSMIATLMEGFFPELTHFEIKEKIRGYIRLEIKNMSIQDIRPEANKYDVKNVIQNREPQLFFSKWSGQRRFKIGLIGDTHFNSKYSLITDLHEYYDYCQKEGVVAVFHSGDIDEGENMRKGHAYECYNQGSDDHVDEIVRVFPKRSGINTYFICGNHDASIYKQCGHDIGTSISDKRDDMIYLGRDCADVYLTPNCVLNLVHPWKGSYDCESKTCKRVVDAMEDDERPQILSIGHFHKQEELLYRGVYCFHSGTYQSKTPFIRGITGMVTPGGWILDVDVDEKGYLQHLKYEFVPAKSKGKDDYKNWISYNR